MLLRGIRVNDVCPGMIQTPMSDKIIAEGQGEELDKMLNTFVPMRRLGRPEEIACCPVALQFSGKLRYRPVDLDRRRLRHALKQRRPIHACKELYFTERGTSA
jgi:NAD(P)-dependent dehydrogenase (short-subunit alcohol dehydrogenase family)